MNEAVFISDLHLHPNESLITERFNQFVIWAAENTRAVYILGDFFHVWPGDDSLDEWSAEIADKLAWLNEQGVQLYFMPGNRDFLLGEQFASRAKMIKLNEPTCIRLGNQIVLLVHGDRYCTLDKNHQWLRRLTRNRIFPWIFLHMPLAFRKSVVYKVRQVSQDGRQLSAENMDIVPSVMLRHMKAFNATRVIHGHIHKPGLNEYNLDEVIHKQYILSDWDDNPKLLCYNGSVGFYFELLIKE